MKGLYSRLPSHSMSFGVFRLDLVHSGRFLMLCRLMAFSAFSIARSKFCLPMSLPVLVPAGYSGSCSVKLSLCPFSFSNDPSMNAWLPLKYVLYRALKACHLRVAEVFFCVEQAANSNAVTIQEKNMAQGLTGLLFICECRFKNSKYHVY